MKIVDSFMFSEPHEKELLLLKLEMENEVVDEWVAIEGSYTFQGEYKGNYLKNILNEDNRFHPFRNKIKIIEVTQNYNKSYLMPPLEYITRYIKHKMSKYSKDIVALSEEAAFFAEKNQREAIVDYMLSNYNDNDYLLLTDVDEMLDATDIIKKKAFLGVLSASESCFKIKRKIFIYDFDNLTCRKRFIPITNLANINKIKVKIKSGVAQYIKHRLLWDDMKEIKLDEELFYEFTYCFDVSKIVRKTKTFAHTGKGEVEIERALLCNHSINDISLIDNDFISNKENWFEKIDVNKKNLPSIVAERFEQLRTNAVAANYKEMRKQIYDI